MTALDDADHVLALAVGFVIRGFSVFPVPRPRPGAAPGYPGDGKIPALKWKDFQTRHPTAHEIAAWFCSRPQNLAIVTGEISSVVVVDVDTDDALSWVIRRLPYTPWQTKTPHGYHLWYRHPGILVPNRARLPTDTGRVDVDVRGDGGYVIGPSSVHASGDRYHHAGDWNARYQDVPVFQPRWLSSTTHTVNTPRPVVANHEGPHVADSHVRARAYLARLPKPEIGAGSDQATFVAACRLVHRSAQRGAAFGLSAADAVDLIWEWAGQRPGWTRAWIAGKVDSAMRRQGA